MEGIVKFAFTTKESKSKTPVVLMECTLKPGDLVIGKDDILFEVNQSTCVFYNRKVVATIPLGKGAKDGEKVTLVWDCIGGKDCQYPICGQYVKCFGKPDNPRVKEYEERNY